MAYHGVSRPDPPASIPQRHSPPDFDTWQEGRRTGRLTLSLETLSGGFVSPGTGRLGLVTTESGETVAQKAARRAGTPVLPGSGIKGAVRTLYELLSFSCDPFQRSECSAPSCCDACSLFGRAGYGSRAGRVSFGDADPLENKVQTAVRNVPTPHAGRPEKTPGDFRLYDFEEATVPKSREKRPKDLAREVYSGTFETRMTFQNLSDEELGRLLLCLGIGLDEETRFHLRLGGVKYDGQGAVRVRPVALRLASARGPRQYERDLTQECERWLRAAQTSAWGQTFWLTLKQVAALLRPKL